MAFNATTLSAAMGIADTTISVASATGITAPNFTSGVGITYLLVEQELMLVTGVSPVSTVFTIQRGVQGSAAAAHGVTAPVLAGLPTDFSAVGTYLGVGAASGSSGFAPMIKSFATSSSPTIGCSAPVASAATIVATGPVFHVTGTVATNIITPYAGFIEGAIVIIADGVWTYTSSAVTNGIAQSGTCTAANTMVTFFYDQKTALWYPSKLA